MASIPIEWTGDLDDDCHARWKDLHAHAENMGDSWYCAVWWSADYGRGPYLFHSTEKDIVPLTGEAARWLCELVMRAATQQTRQARK